MKTKANIDPQELVALMQREQILRDASPEHTLDWYTYNNRVALLEEVRDLITVDEPKKVEKAEKKHVEKTEPAAKEIVKDDSSVEKSKVKDSPSKSAD